jgi:hypothetical protein
MQRVACASRPLGSTISRPFVDGKSGPLIVWGGLLDVQGTYRIGFRARPLEPTRPSSPATLDPALSEGRRC